MCGGSAISSRGLAWRSEIAPSERPNQREQHGHDQTGLSFNSEDNRKHFKLLKEIK
jgi:hypothetical protein